MSVESLRRRLYPDPRRVDPVHTFMQRVQKLTRSDSEVLELGAGAGYVNAHQLRGTVRRIVGVDLSPRVATNPLLDEGFVADVANTPFPDASFDVAFSVYMLEHLADPTAFCGELRRILRPSGVFLALTPNQFHYVATISRLTPHRFHEWFNRTSSRANDAEDTFPTHYRLNTRRALRRHLGAAGFSDISFEMIEVQPNYLMWSRPSLLAGAAYERVVNRTELLAGLRVNIIVSARRERVAA